MNYRIQKAFDSSMYLNWYATFSSVNEIDTVTITEVDMFGENIIGFIKLRVTYKCNETNRLINRVCVLRSNSVAGLIVYTDEATGELYTIMTSQFRAPIGKILLECPAGITETDNPIKDLEREIFEELGGYVIDRNNIEYLGIAYTSPGILDEFTHMFIVRIEGSLENLKNMCSKKTGTENENISLKYFPIDEISKISTSAISELMYYKFKDLDKRSKNV